MDADLYARLSTDSGIAALVGDAISAMVAPKEATGRYLVWQRISGTPAQDAMDGESDIVAARVQIDSYGDNYGQARGLADAVRASLRDWRPTTGAIRHALLENDRAIRETDPALKLFRVSQDYIVTFIQ